MSVLLIGNYEPDGQRSMKRYAELVYAGMNQAGINAKLWVPPVLFGRAVSRASRFFKWLAYIDKLLVAPAVLLFQQRGHQRVHICDHSNAFYAFVVQFRQCTATCHDVIAIQAARGLVAGWAVGAAGRALQRLIAAGLRAVDKVYCVSAFTRNELLDLRLTTAQRTTIALNAVDPLITEGLQAPKTSLAQDTAAAPAKDDRPYFLHVGSDLPRKNRRFVVEVFAELIRYAPFEGHALRLVGPAPEAAQWDRIRQLGLEDRIQHVAGLPNEALARAYASATALLFPSLQEGFGWPVAEAQACGCPVFASALEPMLEVGGSAARYFQPDDPAAAARLVASAPLAQMRVEGTLNSQRFTLSRMVEQLLAP